MWIASTTSSYPHSSHPAVSRHTATRATRTTYDSHLLALWFADWIACFHDVVLRRVQKFACFYCTISDWMTM